LRAGKGFVEADWGRMHHPQICAAMASIFAARKDEGCLGELLEHIFFLFLTLKQILAVGLAFF
jgi:hypothetical protein